jgi:O-antigen/teichoic acid export membrane protein
VGEIVAVPVGFIARIIFIRILGVEYLGVNGLFTSILTMLSLVELGIGPAIVYSLYKPLAEKDIPNVKALMQLYKKAYFLIGTLILLLGIALIPFLHLFVTDASNVQNLDWIFFLFVLNSAVSYFFAYKRNLIVADQQRYIVTVYRFGFFSLVNALQILFLYLTRSYIDFLLLRILCTLLENLFIAHSADKRYPFLKEKTTEKLDCETIEEVKKNTAAMVTQKIGEIVINATDNIVISMRVGTVFVGLYSNYLLVISALNGILGQFFTAITASVGNLGVTESKVRLLDVFGKIQFATFWIFGYSSISLYYLFNPFVRLWVGEDYLLGMETVLLLVVLYYIQGMRRAVLTFREALGLYWYDRYKPIFQSAVNVLLSLVWAPVYGISGVIFATIVSLITTCFLVEPYFLYKIGFAAPLWTYYISYARYTLITLATGYLTGAVIAQIDGSGFAALAASFVLCLVVPNLLFLILFYRTQEYRYFKGLMVEVVRRKRR